MHFFGKTHIHCPLVWCIFLCIFGSVAIPIYARAEVEIPVPSWMDTVTVADKMIINGLPSTVKYFKSDKGLEELLRFYRQRWQVGEGGKQGYKEVNFPPWHILSRLEDKRYLLTVQATSSDALTSNGYLAVADLKGVKKKSDRAGSIPKMKGSRIVNDLTSFDPGRKGRTVLAVNKYSVESNSEYYRNYYSGRGWGKSIDIENDGAQVLAFSRFGKEAHFVISRNFGSTQVVMNFIESN